jgi:hypothetical protein
LDYSVPIWCELSTIDYCKLYTRGNTRKYMEIYSLDIVENIDSVVKLNR